MIKILTASAMTLVTIASNITDVSTCPTATIVDPTTDQSCPSNCHCQFNCSSYKCGSDVQVNVGFFSTAEFNFYGFVNVGYSWTIRSAGTTTVNCGFDDDNNGGYVTNACYDIRLLGDGITAKCFGTNACYNAECEGASSKIVQCKGTNACYDAYEESNGCKASLASKSNVTEELSWKK